jgi:hypothetical protein
MQGEKTMKLTLLQTQLFCAGERTTLQPGDRMVLDAAKNSVQFVRGAVNLRLVHASSGSIESGLHCEFGKNASAQWLFIAQLVNVLRIDLDVKLVYVDDDKVVFELKKSSGDG